MRHGYFIAETGEMHGDPEFAERSKALFEALDLNPKFCGNYDGASMAQHDPEGPISKVICLRDFFRTEFKVIVHMLPLVKDADLN